MSLAIMGIAVLSFAAGARTFSEGHRLAAGPGNATVDTNGADAGSKLGKAVAEIKRTYVERITDDALVDAAITAMVEELDDPFSHYMPKKDFQDMQRVTRGNYEGIGIAVAPKDGKIVVQAVYAGTPAKKAGLEIGDLIIRIGSATTKKMSIDKAVSLIRGPPGSKVRLTLERPDEGQYSASIIRKRITIPNVEGRLDDGRIGYMHLTQFNQNSEKDLRAELDRLRKKGAKGVVLDLRGNPGGLLEQAIEVSSIFIPSGVVVSTKGRTGEEARYEVTGGAITELPVVVLIDKGSASASEIVAGAIQDSGRGEIVGERSFGKASVQEVIQLGDGSGMTITTAHYYTPKGRDIAKKGIHPDVVVKRAKPKKGEKPASPHTGGKPKDDVQLKAAEDILKKLIDKR